MQLPRRVAVYCGASPRIDDRHRALAREVGTRLAAAGVTIVYGAGRTGMMGEVADASLANGGKVIGVIPSRISTNEVAHDGLSELIVVDSMHARKQLMVGLSDAIVALPGGFGTLDELFEAITWRQLGYNDKPVIVCDESGYYDELFAFLDRAEREAFLRSEHREQLVRTHSVDELFAALAAAHVPRSRIG